MDVEKESRFYGRALQELDHYIETRLAPRVGELGQLPPQKDAMWLILLCARSLLEALARATRPAAFRAHAVLCRGLWEQWVDFETIRRGDEAAASQYLAFADVQAWNHFNRVRVTRRELGYEDIQLPIDEPHAEKRVASVLDQHYGVDLPDARKIKYWNHKDLFRRACDLGKEEHLYHREFYSFLSWATHGSAAGVAGMAREFLDRCSLQWRIEAFGIFMKMTRLLVEGFGMHEEERPELERIAGIAIGDYRGPDCGQLEQPCQ